VRYNLRSEKLNISIKSNRYLNLITCDIIIKRYDIIRKKPLKMAIMTEIKIKKEYEIVAILTTITQGYNRISMHGVRENLLEKQAESLDLPLEKMFISKDATNDEYEARMGKLLEDYKNKGVNSVVFGDIFLAGVRQYRQDNLAKIEMKGMFPLWGENTDKLAQKFIDLGFRAIITCVDSECLSGDFVGREFDKEFLTDLPEGVDPCGENGEFHSYVYDGPIFKERIAYEKGDIVLRENRFYFCDLIPKEIK
jgi:uncharacterized protein (TIGR00290 family)